MRPRILFWENAALLLCLNRETEHWYRVAVVLRETPRRALDGIMLRRISAKHSKDSWLHDVDSVSSGLTPEMTDGGQLVLQADQNGSPPFGPSNGSANTLRAISLWQP